MTNIPSNGTEASFTVGISPRGLRVTEASPGATTAARTGCLQTDTWNGNPSHPWRHYSVAKTLARASLKTSSMSFSTTFALGEAPMNTVGRGTTSLDSHGRDTCAARLARDRNARLTCPQPARYGEYMGMDTKELDAFYRFACENASNGEAQSIEDALRDFRARQCGWQPRTPLGARLKDLREQFLADGGRLLTADEVEADLRDRRGCTFAEA